MPIPPQPNYTFGNGNTNHNDDRGNTFGQPPPSYVTDHFPLNNFFFNGYDVEHRNGIGNNDPFLTSSNSDLTIDPALLQRAPSLPPTSTATAPGYDAATDTAPGYAFESLGDSYMEDSEGQW